MTLEIALFISLVVILPAIPPLTVAYLWWRDRDWCDEDEYYTPLPKYDEGDEL